MLLPVSQVTQNLKVTAMLLFLFASTSLGAQDAKADTCQMAKVKKPNTERSSVNQKQEMMKECEKKKNNKKKKKSKSIEDGFLFKKHTLSHL